MSTKVLRVRQVQTTPEALQLLERNEVDIAVLQQSGNFMEPTVESQFYYCHIYVVNEEVRQIVSEIPGVRFLSASDSPVPVYYWHDIYPYFLGQLPVRFTRV